VPAQRMYHRREASDHRMIVHPSMERQKRFETVSLERLHAVARILKRDSIRRTRAVTQPLLQTRNQGGHELPERSLPQASRQPSSLGRSSGIPCAIPCVMVESPGSGMIGEASRERWPELVVKPCHLPACAWGSEATRRHQMLLVPSLLAMLSLGTCSAPREVLTGMLTWAQEIKLGSTQYAVTLAM
jgi:hypothetical protein